ncbi:anthranilate phosphoribosyltransferase [Edaphobacter sp. 12200R-103]|jgi:anthranilate phosphoribosyltransferase|uniref:anthranilate phosphoribosyltransferase n=1 Tax=Edaphobacter sp. 12200R-103 TaxID=2703788 RepID=UPI00138DC14F|nr:anthranilate phosphoribosyltransferase [Edaphobacter sp. 12200R-103]QHS52214.1 anthranilate phosphoribosyltransferase [Edaphobacter sp. 12200R-103]
MPLPFPLKHVIESRATLSREQARELMQQIVAGGLSDVEIAGLVGALAARGETPAEVAGFVDVMRSEVTRVPLSPEEQAILVDTCGTGGDASRTFNISTAAALVAAAAGASIAKHGNRAITSQCGSADVLEALGVPVDLSPEAASSALRRYHFAFLHAPSLHPAMKAVMPVRRAIKVRTVFNLLGPLTNPAGASAQVMGVYAQHAVALVAETMALLGTRHAFVVHGTAEDPDGTVRGLDEISISGPTDLAEVRNGVVTLSTITPEELGLERAPMSALAGGDAKENAAILMAIFSGERGPRRDIVLLNAAAVLVAADLSPDLPTGIALAEQTIDSGAVTKLLDQLRSGT